jgi:glycerol kinase
MTTVLAIDQGTTATKAVVIGADEEVLAHAAERIATTALPGGGMEQDPEEIWRSIQSAAGKAIARAGNTRGIDAVALATQGESVLAFDPHSGTPLSPLITWQDRRADGICRRLADHADELAAATGLRLSSYFTAPKLVWLRENVTRDGVIGTIDTWLLHRLTGHFATDTATASRSLLVDLASGTWNPRLTDIFGLADERLPRIVANDEIVGQTREFGPPVPVAGVILDQPAALLAQRRLKPGQAKVTYGTGAFLLANAGSPVPEALVMAPGATPAPGAAPTPAPGVGSGALTCSTAWQIGGQRTLCLDGQVFSAASAISWLSRIGVLRRAADLDTVCADSPGGVVFVPSFDEPGGARITGLDLATGRGQLVSAAIHGIAAAVAELYDQAGLAEDVLSVDGGLTNSTMLMQVQADLLQVPVRAYPGAHATAQGAAVLARIALDRTAVEELEAAPDRQATELIHPKWSRDQATEYRTRWRETAGRTDPGSGRKIPPKT